MVSFIIKLEHLLQHWSSKVLWPK